MAPVPPARSETMEDIELLRDTEAASAIGPQSHPDAPCYIPKTIWIISYS
jgi:hypothetical protein